MQLFKQMIALVGVSVLVATPPAFGQNTTPDDLPPLVVQTTTVTADDTPLTRQFFGRVAALETAALSFEVGGYLTFLDAREGTRVRAGERLAELDLAPFERAVERAELNLEQSVRDVERATQLASRNVTSEVRAEDARTARDLAEVALAEARDALEDARITAPFDGLIADRIASNFTNVAPGEPIVRIHNLSEIRVEFELPERLLSEIGDPSAVSFEAEINGNSDPVPLAFREFRAETGRVGQSYTISLALSREAGPLVIPGKTVSVRASLQRPATGHRVPATAVTTSPDGTQFVVEVVPDGDTLRARRVPVTVATLTGTEILADGIAPGTEIVAVGAHLVENGQPLRRYTGLTVEGN